MHTHTHARIHTQTQRHTEVNILIKPIIKGILTNQKKMTTRGLLGKYPSILIS